MATFLFDEIIFGPVKSRRLGASLGINLLPKSSKYCNFNCIYCECGWSENSSGASIKLPDRNEVRTHLESRLVQMKENGELPETITFAGNGEPTLHPEFAGIIHDTIELRDSYAPATDIAVLSNSTMLSKAEVLEAMKKIEQPILKLDSLNDETVRLINQPPQGYRVSHVMEKLKLLKGNFILQTLFVQGSFQNQPVNNATDEEVTNWLRAVEELKPKLVMVYTIARDTPIQTLKKIEQEKLDAIAERVRELGIDVQVSY